MRCVIALTGGKEGSFEAGFLGGDDFLFQLECRNG